MKRQHIKQEGFTSMPMLQSLFQENSHSYPIIVPDDALNIKNEVDDADDNSARKQTDQLLVINGPPKASDSLSNEIVSWSQRTDIEVTNSSPASPFSNTSLAYKAEESISSSPPVSDISSKSTSNSSKSSTVNTCNLDLSYNIPSWLTQECPEICEDWRNISGSDYHQGRVKLVCSFCKKNPAAGFHEDLPLCEVDREQYTLPCSVCRLNYVAKFKYGLALCQKDIAFLNKKIFGKQPRLTKCPTSCPPRREGWCEYCRFKRCLTTRGFRFEPAKNLPKLSNESKKRKFSEKIDVQSVSPKAVSTNRLISEIESEKPNNFVKPIFKLRSGVSAVARSSSLAANPHLKGFMKKDKTVVNQTQENMSGGSEIIVQHDKKHAIFAINQLVEPLNSESNLPGEKGTTNYTKLSSTNHASNDNSIVSEAKPAVQVRSIPEIINKSNQMEHPSGQMMQHFNQGMHQHRQIGTQPRQSLPQYNWLIPQSSHMMPQLGPSIVQSSSHVMPLTSHVKAQSSPMMHHQYSYNSSAQFARPEFWTRPPHQSPEDVIVEAAFINGQHINPQTPKIYGLPGNQAFHLQSVPHLLPYQPQYAGQRFPSMNINRGSWIRTRDYGINTGVGESSMQYWVRQQEEVKRLMLNNSGARGGCEGL